MYELSRARRAIKPLRPLGVGAGPCQRRGCLSVHAEPAGVPGNLAWRDSRRGGGCVALLNTNLVGPALAHCVDIVAPKHIIVASELMEAFATTQLHRKTKAKVWVHGDGFSEFPRIDSELERHSPHKLTEEERRSVTIND